MLIEQIPISAAPGTTTMLTVLRFGQRSARPRAYIQAALHADEIPGMLAAQHLRERLMTLESEGRIRGEAVLVPFANPIGLAQRVLGSGIGRFDLSDGLNFNRGYPLLVEAAAERVAGRLGPDAAANAAAIRRALAEALREFPARSPAEHLKRILLGLAIEADLVLDLHCDGEAARRRCISTP